MEDFKKGDIVQLKSGGPKMTIYEATRSTVSCTWFDNNNSQHYSKFDVETIRKV